MNTCKVDILYRPKKPAFVQRYITPIYKIHRKGIIEKLHYYNTAYSKYCESFGGNCFDEWCGDKKTVKEMKKIYKRIQAFNKVLKMFPDSEYIYTCNGEYYDEIPN